MTRELQKTDAGRDFIQFRGPQTSVTHDGTGVHFGTEHRHGMVVHAAYPVVDPDADDPPEDAVARPVAESIVEASPLVCWGVACEVEGCDQVFENERGEASHYGAVHADDSDQDADADTEEDTQSVGGTDTDGEP